MPERRPGARELALHICLAVVSARQSLSGLLEDQLGALADDRDKALCSELCYGFCRFYFLFQADLAQLLRKPLKSRDQDVGVMLVLGMYQLRFMRVSDHAAVNETVKLTRVVGKDWARGMVNGTLRNYQRKCQSEQPGLGLDLTAAEQAQAYPQWLQQRIGADWPQYAPQVLAAGNQQPPMVIRVDLSRQTRDQYLAKLTQSDIVARAHPQVDSAIVLQRPVSIEDLPGFARADVSIQDAAAQLAAPLLDLEPGMRVLDACAAPGGKTLHILQSCANLDVLALDHDESRLQRVVQNLDRAQLKARTLAVDAAAVGEWASTAQFDRILLDVPCSASGIIRRHPDIRILRRDEDIAQLARQQQRLLSAVWSQLRPGGLLLYSTCSVFKAENEDQIQAFIADHDECVERPLNPVQWGQARPYGRQILPGVDEMDGFYYALLEKKD